MPPSLYLKRMLRNWCLERIATAGSEYDWIAKYDQVNPTCANNPVNIWSRSGKSINEPSSQAAENTIPSA